MFFLNNLRIKNQTKNTGQFLPFFVGQVKMYKGNCKTAIKGVALTKTTCHRVRPIPAKLEHIPYTNWQKLLLRA